MIFYESDLQFNFKDANWLIKKYDAHRYYKTLSGVGLKGIDFLGILDQEKIVFFEVKNFHTNHPTQNASFSVLEDTPSFIDAIADKLEDSFKAVDIIIAYLKRKNWYRLFLKWKKYIPRFFVQNRDWYFWHIVHQLSKDKENLILVLWLEIDSPLSPISLEKLKNSIDKNLAAELFDFVGKVEVSDRNHPIFQDSLEVRLFPSSF